MFAAAVSVALAWKRQTALAQHIHQMTDGPAEAARRGHHPLPSPEAASDRRLMRAEVNRSTATTDDYRQAQPDSLPIEAAEAHGTRTQSSAKDPRHLTFRKRWRTPIALFIIGCALGLWAKALIPSRAVATSPPENWLIVSSPVEVHTIRYHVSRLGRTTYSVLVAIGPNFTSSDKRSVAVGIGFPHSDKVKVRQCPPTALCDGYFDAAGGVIVPGVNGYLPLDGSGPLFEFQVTSPVFAFSTNGEIAQASIPQITYYGPGVLNVGIEYELANADSYDWSSSSISPAYVAESLVEWNIQLSSNQKASETQVAGTNHSTQQHDDRNTFFAGALVGVGGSALIGGLQEALHLGDTRVQSPATSPRQRRRRRGNQGQAVPG
jgi:hypothetical protein